MIVRWLAGRVRGWATSTLTVPTRPAVDWMPPALPVRRPDGLFGHASRGRVVVETALGEIPIPAGCRVSVLEVTNAVAWINGLPEITPGSRPA